MINLVLRRSAGLAAACVACMFLLFSLTGVGQEGLQVFSSPPVWTARLLAAPHALELTLLLDDAFILFYTTTFLALAALRWPALGTRVFLVSGTALLLVTGALDLGENLDFLVKLRAAQEGVLPSAEAVQARVWASLLKFHASYAGLWLLGHALPVSTAVERGLVLALRWFQWPVGLAVALVPREVAVPLVVLRLVFFLGALLALRHAAARPGFASAPAAAETAQVDRRDAQVLGDQFT